jgi:hypothetical protein
MTVSSKAASTAKTAAPATATATAIDSLMFPCQLSSASKAFLDDLVVRVGGAQGSVEVSDDLKLEGYFQRQALCAAVAAKTKILALGRAFWKPATHHVHLLKTSAHLARVASEAAKDTNAAKSRETARLQRVLKKDGKAVQQRTLAERNAEKRATLRAVDALKKRRSPADDGDEFDVQTAVEDIIRGRDAKGSGPGTKKSQAWRDSKYGFGGLGASSHGKGKGKGTGMSKGTGRKGGYNQTGSHDHKQIVGRDARPAPSKSGKKVAKRPGKGRRQAMRHRSRK